MLVNAQVCVCVILRVNTSAATGRPAPGVCPHWLVYALTTWVRDT